jgi:glycosyltransferase involved in cell wall biosynthesis
MSFGSERGRDSVSSSGGVPKISIAVPLYRSARFLPILVETLHNFDYPNLEFLVSDRHQDDDAIEQLRAIFGADQRFQFLPADDRMDWVGHYNFLLQQATGEYFIWVSHDDSYSPNFLKTLAQALNENPDVIVAHGMVQRITLDGKPLPSPSIPRRRESGAPNPVRAYRTTLNGLHVFHGLFRRQPLVDRRLWIRPTPENVAADALWIFTVALIGRVRFVESCTFIKRYHPDSAHKRWDHVMQPRFMWDLGRVTRSYLDAYAPSRVHYLAGRVVITLACTLWFLRIIARGRRRGR